MSDKTPWRKMINPDYLGAYSLDNGHGGYNDIVLTIKGIKTEEVTGPEGKKESCMILRSAEQKPMIVNSTNAKAIEKVTKSAYIEDWIDKKIQVGVEKVRAFGEVFDALRVRTFPPRVAAPVAPPPTTCTNCHNPITATARMTVPQVVDWTTGRFGLPICAACATKLIEAEKVKEAQPPTDPPAASEPPEQKEGPANAE